jgi:hypothetical protein
VSSVCCLIYSYHRHQHNRLRSLSAFLFLPSLGCRYPFLPFGLFR